MPSSLIFIRNKKLEKNDEPKKQFQNVNESMLKQIGILRNMYEICIIYIN